MSHDKGIGYSIWNIFVALFVLTGVEVFWGYAFHHNTGFMFHMPVAFFWSGLLLMAVVKGLLIFMYFMHMRFERWIVWGLILPTPLLVMIVLAANMPDTSFNDQRDHPIGYLIDETGEVVNALDPLHPAKGRGTPHGASHADGAAPAEAGH
jgi:cytochrome c oxidase subunit IV